MIYAKNAADFSKKIQENRLVSMHKGAKEYDNAIILPLHINKKYPEELNEFLGGVCDSDLNFIAGAAVQQNRFSCPQAYYETEITNDNEAVVFGGVFYNHFGVMLLLSLTRFWWILKNPHCPYKIVFLAEPDRLEAAKGNCKAFMDILEIPGDKYGFVSKATRYSKVIVPDEVLTAVGNNVDVDYILPYKALSSIVMERLGASPYPRIYLSRSRYSKAGAGSDGINEEFYERFFEKRGYYVIHPQELPLCEQIRLIASADEAVSTYGTLAHMISLFGKSSVRQIMLLRSEYMDPWFTIEADILRMRDIDWYIVEAAQNPYPTLHDGGAFLYYPTEYFKDFLEEVHIAYEPSEMESTITRKQMKQYVIHWLKCYSHPSGFKRLGNPGLFPIMQSLYYNITGTILDSKDYMI